MRTAEEIHKEFTGHAHGLMDAMTIKAMKAYAEQAVNEALRMASDVVENEEYNYLQPQTIELGNRIKQSILSLAPKVLEKLK